MKQEDKELLLKDLCARSPYGVKYDIVLDDGKYGSGGVLYDDLKNGYLDIEDLHIVRPYLRPMPSMTGEEKIAFNKMLGGDNTNWYLFDDKKCIAHPKSYYTTSINFSTISKIQDWLNAHHFDYHGLIEKGLALEAPEDMYKININVY